MHSYQCFVILVALYHAYLAHRFLPALPDMVVRCGLQLDQIGTKWDKSGTFKVLAPVYEQKPDLKKKSRLPIWPKWKPNLTPLLQRSCHPVITDQGW